MKDVNLSKHSGIFSFYFKKSFKVFASIECRILKALSKGGFKNAFMCLPRSGRSLYVHAFQSLLWNQVIFWKLTKFLQITLLEAFSLAVFSSLLSLLQVLYSAAFVVNFFMPLYFPAYGGGSGIDLLSSDCLAEN